MTLENIFALSEEEAWQWFVMWRWGSLTSMPCPECGTVDQHCVRRTRRQWRCKHCDRIFSVTSDSPFADRKLPFRKLLLLIFLFVTNAKGLAATQFSYLGMVTYRTAYQNLSKLREVLYFCQNRTPLSGTVHIDGGHFCGKPRRPNRKTKMTSSIANNYLRNRKAGMVPGQPLDPWNAEKFKNRRIILVLRQLFDTGTEKGTLRTITAIVPAETKNHVLPIIMKYVELGATIQTDEGGAFAGLIKDFNHETVRHSAEYSTSSGVNNNQAESYFSRVRRGEYGTYHGMRPQYLACYAAEFAWKEDVKRKTISEKITDLIEKVFRSDISLAFRGYCQGHRLGYEYMG